jgi:hypothetical protein
MSVTEQLRELLGFLLLDQQPHIQCIALQHLLPVSSAKSEHKSIFLTACPRDVAGQKSTWLAWIAHLATLQGFDVTGQHDALKILINQSDEPLKAQQILRTPGFLEALLQSLTVSPSKLRRPPSPEPLRSEKITFWQMQLACFSPTSPSSQKASVYL